MTVQDIMTRKVMAISPDMAVSDVMALMEQRNIRHFPILEHRQGDDSGERHGVLVGIVSDRDLRTVGGEHPSARPAVSMASPVSDIMVRDVLTAHPLDPIEEAARVLREHRIGAMPVMDGDQLVGIVTGIDFLDALVAMTGVNRSTSRLEVELTNRPGALAALLDRIAGLNHNVCSVFQNDVQDDTVTFVLRVETINGHTLAARLREQGFQVLWPAGS